MAANAKSTQDAPPEAAAPVETETFELPFEFPIAAVFGCLLHKGLDRVVDTQKTWLDRAGQHGVRTIDAWRRTVRVPPESPVAFALDVAAEATGRIVETQKSVVGLVGEQGGGYLDMALERGETATRMAAGAAGALRQSLGRTLAAQRTVFDIAAQQSRETLDSAKRQMGIAGTPLATVADSFQLGVDLLIETQKELLNFAAAQSNPSAANR